MGRELRLIHAKGEQKIPSAQTRAQRAPRNLLGRLVQDSAVHFLGILIRSFDSEFRSDAVPSQ